MSTVAAERVLVVPTEVFHSLGYFQGFQTDTRVLAQLLQPEHVSYRPRGEMETDPSFKQLIPYVVFRHTDPAGNVTLFHYTRGSGQGETRLRQKVSVGVGGHISSVNDVGETYEEGMRRELAEEVAIDTQYQATVAGMINDDETEVGKVHLGVVHLFDVAQPKVTALEPDILEAGFESVGQLMDRREEMESWSRITIEALYG
ncbi:MAG: NUDIX domain-containing protein [Planctomycetota bacterium]